jgi:UDP-N-acetyl-D-mannosaminuronate dehydrogenase
MGETARFVELAREINDRMPAYVVQRIVNCLNDEGKSLKTSSILVLGVTYKAEVADVRESPAVEIIKRLLKTGAEVRFHDPFIEEIALEPGGKADPPPGARLQGRHRRREGIPRAAAGAVLDRCWGGSRGV